MGLDGETGRGPGGDRTGRRLRAGRGGGRLMPPARVVLLKDLRRAVAARQVDLVAAGRAEVDVEALVERHAAVRGRSRS